MRGSQSTPTRSAGHVLMVEPTPGMRGPQRTLLTFARYLAPRIPLTIAVPEGFVSRSARAEIGDLDVLTLPFRANSRARSWFEGERTLLGTMGRWRDEVLVIHANGLSALNLAAPLAKAINAPVLVHSHTSAISWRNRAFIRLWRQAGVRMAIHPVSSFARGLLEGTVMRPLVQTTLPNPFEVPVNSRNGRGPGRPFRVGWMGSKSPGKGLDRLIEVAHRLGDEDVEWLLYGVDPESRTSYVERCARTIHEYGLDRRMRWCGKTDDPSSAYREMDAVLLTSSRESFSRVAIEAMAHGLPVVAARASGTEEVVWDGVSGWLFDATRPEDGAEHLRRLIGDPALWRRHAARAAAAAARFDVTVVGPRLEQAYAELLARTSRQRRSADMNAGVA